MSAQASVEAGTAVVKQGNALDLDLPDNSVDLVVTSPPYFGLRSYRDGNEHMAEQVGAEATPQEYVDGLLAATAEMMRVLRPAGSIFVNLGDKYNAYNGNRGDGRLQRNDRRPLFSGGHGLDVVGVPNKSLLALPWRYAIRAVDELGLLLRQDIVWAKANPMPESVKDRCARSHEFFFHLTKQPRYYADLDAIREPHESAPAKAQRSAALEQGETRNPAPALSEDIEHNPLGRLPRDVWRIASEPLRVPEDLSVRHFAAYPTALVAPIVKAWCPPGGTVLDPFGGTGTTALVAKALGRHGISVDLSADYCRLAEWRVNDPKQLEKASNL